MALRCAGAARTAVTALLAVDGVDPLVDCPGAPRVRRRAPRRRPTSSSSGWPTRASWPGSPLDDGYTPTADDGLLVAVTERRTRHEIDAYVAAFEKAVR